MVPGSSACNRLEKRRSKKPPCPPGGPRSKTVKMTANTRISATVATISQAISAGVPRDMVLSNM